MRRRFVRSLVEPHSLEAFSAHAKPSGCAKAEAKTVIALWLAPGFHPLWADCRFSQILGQYTSASGLWGPVLPSIGPERVMGESGLGTQARVLKLTFVRFPWGLVGEEAVLCACMELHGAPQASERRPYRFYARFPQQLFVVAWPSRAYLSYIRFAILGGHDVESGERRGTRACASRPPPPDLCRWQLHSGEVAAQRAQQPLMPSLMQVLARGSMMLSKSSAMAQII